VLTLALAFLSGALSTLSPCVLPLLPIVLGAAVSEHRFGPAALAAGVAISFVGIGLFIATAGFALGLDQSVFRVVAAILMIAIGAILVLPPLQAHVALAAAPLGSYVQSAAGDVPREGLGGQFAVGLLLGAVWSPCVGPTLGAASVLATQGKDLVAVGATMLIFGIGAALPLLVLGTLSREALLRWCARLLNAGHSGKIALGLVLVAVGALIVTGIDKQIETVLVDASPGWLNALTTRF
jgi:cytochrome c biogenesis protein CcdA